MQDPHRTSVLTAGRAFMAITFEPASRAANACRSCAAWVPEPKASDHQAIHAGPKESHRMNIRALRRFETILRRSEQKRLVGRVVHEPAKLVRKRVDRREVGFHLLEKRVARHP